MPVVVTVNALSANTIRRKQGSSSLNSTQFNTICSISAHCASWRRISHISSILHPAASMT